MKREREAHHKKGGTTTSEKSRKNRNARIEKIGGDFYHLANGRVEVEK